MRVVVYPMVSIRTGPWGSTASEGSLWDRRLISAPRCRCFINPCKQRGASSSRWTVVSLSLTEGKWLGGRRGGAVQWAASAPCCAGGRRGAPAPSKCSGSWAAGRGCRATGLATQQAASGLAAILGAAAPLGPPGASSWVQLRARGCALVSPCVGSAGKETRQRFLSV